MLCARMRHNIRDLRFAVPALERRAAYDRMRRQIVALRRDAAYWRRHGRPGRAAEIERVAAYLEPRAQALAESVLLLKELTKGRV